MMETFSVTDPGRTACGPTGLPSEPQNRQGSKLTAGPQASVCIPDGVDAALSRFEDVYANGPTQFVNPDAGLRASQSAIPKMIDVPEGK